MFRLLFTLCFCAPVFTLTIKEIISDDNFIAFRDKCLQKLNLKPENLAIPEDPKDIPEEGLCIFKCIQEEQKVLDENGKLDMQKLNSMSNFQKFPEDQKATVSECLSEIPEIKECKDVLNEMACYFKVIAKN